MKKKYEELQCELLFFATADVLTLSDNEKDDLGYDIFAPNN